MSLTKVSQLFVNEDHRRFCPAHSLHNCYIFFYVYSTGVVLRLDVIIGDHFLQDVMVTSDMDDYRC